MDDNDMYKREEGDRPVERSPRGRYIRFDIRLGSGAYKTVYKAYDTDQGIDVAWNAIDIGVLPSTEKTRIIQEVQLLQKLEHKNIINFYGSWFSKEKNQVVFITEIMTSGTLKSYIKRVQFIKWKIIKRWCIQILEGLHYLHSQNPPVIHRDLKCDNIFINGNTGDLRIGDLGLSTQLAVHKRSKAQSVLGTPEFMAPELYDESYDEKVDIYAFGMCVLEMVTKEVPYSECVNPAQIYKKVTAGIRPKGLQRVVSQNARDFIELCLSRGNGEIDVSAEYLLGCPFLKTQDDDGEMVQVLSEDELEREEKQEQMRLSHVSEEKFADELNMESASKGSDQSSMTDRRKQFPSLSLEPQEISTGVSGTTSSMTGGHAGSVTGSTELRNEIPAEEKSAGKHHIMGVPHVHFAGSVSSSSVSSTASSQPSVALPPLPPLPPTAMINHGVPDVDEPLSGKKDVDHHVNHFLATMPDDEKKIQNTRMKLMTGRNHHLEVEDVEDAINEDDTTYTTTDTPQEMQKEQVELGQPNATPNGQFNYTPTLSPPAQSPPPMHSPPVSVAPMQQPSMQPVRGSDINPDYSQLRRSSFHTQSEGIAPVSYEMAHFDASGRMNNRPQSASSSASGTATITSRKRGKRHEIRAVKDPDNPHSILLNLRIMIDGKSKEIKFPFNLFADSTHEVACELAVDVGIMEPDLEDIADSIGFLVTEGKINNLPDVAEDVWEEAPEPHSFSSKPLPNVSKMNFVLATSTTQQQQQQQQHHHQQQQQQHHHQQQQQHPQQPPSNAQMFHGSTPLNMDRAQTIPVFSLPDSAMHHDSNAQANPSLGTRNANLHQGILGSSPQPVGVSTELIPPTKQDPMSTAYRSEAPSPLITLDNSNAASGNSSSTTNYLVNDFSRSPHHHGMMVHASSESNLPTEDHANKLELRERGISMGSTADHSFIRNAQQLEDRMKHAKSAFDERESTLEAAIRSEEEKHQREIERFRKKMEEFNKQRAAIARKQNSEDVKQSEVDQLQMSLDEFRLQQNGGLLSPSLPPPQLPLQSTGAGQVGNNGMMDMLYGQSPSRMDLTAVPPPLVRNISADTRRYDGSIMKPGNGQVAVSYMSPPSNNADLLGTSPMPIPMPSSVVVTEDTAQNL